MNNRPFANGQNGSPDRGSDGKFRPGNSAAQGRRRPHAARVAELRQALLDAIDPARITKIVVALADAAESGDVQAARVLLDRVFGPPVAEDIIERIEQLEAEIGTSESEARR